MNVKLEVACFNVQSALAAEAAGAHRIEFCDKYQLGGITPSEKDIKLLKQSIKIPLYVIIRPRGGNFVYSEQEKKQMREAVTFCQSQGVNGIVFGALTEDGKIDKKFCEDLISLARKMSLTFHRAIDQCVDLPMAMEELISIGIHRVLSSGAADVAINGLGTLKKMHELVNQSMVVMPGGGIRANQIHTFLDAGFREIHSSAITGNTESVDPEEIKKILLTFQQHA